MVKWQQIEVLDVLTPAPLEWKERQVHPRHPNLPVVLKSAILCMCSRVQHQEHQGRSLKRSLELLSAMIDNMRSGWYVWPLNVQTCSVLSCIVSSRNVFAAHFNVPCFRCGTACCRSVDIPTWWQNNSCQGEFP